MQNKKAVAAGITILLIAVIVIILFIPKNTQQMKVSELAFDNLDLSASPGVGFELVFENDNFIIFYGDCGLFGYDLTKQEMAFEIDFVKAYGKKGSVQGSYGTYVEVSSDGKTVALTYTDPDNPDIVNDAYFIDVPTLTYRKGEYQPITDIFQKENAVGYVRPGGKISSTVYIRGDEEWAVFNGYNEP